jgi:hypothetical protein
LLVVVQFEKHIPRRLEAAIDFGAVAARLKEVAKKVILSARSRPQALKRKSILSRLAARVELVPFAEPTRK